MKQNGRYAANRIIKIGIFIFIIMAIFSLIELVFYSSLELKIVDFIKVYTFFAVFIISFMLDLIMQPLGPDIVIVGGILLRLNWMLVAFWAILGSLIASFIGYWLGRIYGSFGFKHKYYMKQYQRAEKFYAHYGKLGLSIAAISPLPYVPFCWIAGIFGMKKIDFILFGIIPRAGRFIIIAYLAHFLVLF